jgi:urease accessory protein
MGLLPAMAMAHPGHVSAGFLDGLSHPISGIDHLLAMLATGLWAVQLGGAATWRVPAAFVTCMVLGASLAFAGVGLPMAETWIATSVLALGLLVATRRSFATTTGAMIAGAMALAHGHAHGAEMAAGMSTAAYALGFVIMTSLLHIAGVVIARGLHAGRLDGIVRWLGAVTSGVGAWLLLAA